MGKKKAREKKVCGKKACVNTAVLKRRGGKNAIWEEGLSYGGQGVRRPGGKKAFRKKARDRKKKTGGKRKIFGKKARGGKEARGKKRRGRRPGWALGWVLGSRGN